MEIKEQLERIQQEAKTATEKAVAEGTKAAELKAAEIVKTATEAFDLKLKDAEQKHAAQVQDISVKYDEKAKQLDEALTTLNRVKEQQNQERIKSFADVIGSALEAKKDAIGSYANNVGTKSLDIAVPMDTKAVGVIGRVAGLEGDWQGAVGPAYEMEHLRNAIQVIPTQRDVIKYLRFSRKEGAIGMVAAGAAKPKLDFNTTVEEAPVRKIAGIVDVVDEFLEDTPGAIEFLRTELPQALLEVEDAQILKGDGTGQNLEGLFQVAAALNPALFTDVATLSNSWDRLAAAISQVRLAKRATTAAWVSPQVYLSLLINKDDNAGYTYPIVLNNMGQLTIGGVPIMQHSALAATEGIVGDFARGVKIFQRMGAVINFSTENKDNFETNVTSVRIEERIALPIYYPDGFVKIDFTAAPAV
ncbi:HK97 family phage major capsid protein [Pontibacter mucosus]|uniref:HK97 family phage major capsid protein n=1 Tax=Pontibacter mucosus TaxID=1649266 RepID=A0A2T5YD53_9BACT|nr:phage major capsid protein [Pontibacter mucosus]PTX14452.1 HK97 family phage major capsid protein [Pontibacter mucosus]